MEQDLTQNHLDRPIAFLKSVKARAYNCALIIDAAIRHHLEVDHLDGLSYMVSGNGREVFFNAQMAGQISFGATKIVEDKSLTIKILNRHGLPTPRSGRFRKHQKEDALRFFKEIRTDRAVMKPANAAHGHGVHTNIREQSDFEEAWSTIFARWRSVIVEEFVPGIECRYFVLDSKVLAVTCRVPAHVVGDGSSSIANLIRQKNNEERRQNVALEPVPDDDLSIRVLAEQGYGLDSIPELDRIVYLRKVSNISQGGDSVDVTDEVDPSIKQLAVDALHSIPGLLYTGLDIIAEDHRRPLQGQSVRIIEMNDYPMLSMHHFPAHGTVRPVADAIIRHLFFGNDQEDLNWLPFDRGVFMERCRDPRPLRKATKSR
jgi:D-alanine-D-alanine ligase-like ATP-grasp enzyme